MKKVRCPRCLVVNLERFVTFPYCAGCGARLPVGESEAAPHPAWRRPLGVLLWTSLFSVTLLGLFVAVRVFEVPLSRAPDVSATGSAPRRVVVGEAFALRLNVEAAEGTKRDATLRAMQLRVLQSSLKDLIVLEIQPQPNAIVDRGRARYYEYTSFSAGDAVTLKMRATQSGHRSLQIQFLVENQLQGAPVFIFDVAARDANREKRRVAPTKWRATGAVNMAACVARTKEILMSVSPEDKQVAASARRALAKTQLDITQLNISCVRGMIDLTGTVRAPRNYAGDFSVRKEFQLLITVLRNVRGVKDVHGDRVRIFD